MVTSPRRAAPAPTSARLSIWRAVLPAAPDEPFRYRFVWRSDFAARYDRVVRGLALALDIGRRRAGLRRRRRSARSLNRSSGWSPPTDRCGCGSPSVSTPTSTSSASASASTPSTSAGRTLDAVVFEQYKQQGARTYLPSPFAIVAGGEGWGFHVRTSRRTWFDVGHDRP